MREAVRLARFAEACFAKLGEGKGTRLVLSLFFKAVCGIPRIFHFQSLDDVGFAILTGGRRVLSRNMLGGLVRATHIKNVLAFVKRTEPKIPERDDHLISIDEHAIARFTKKFAIKKGFHTIRNKRMKIEKLFFAFDLGTRRLLSLVVKPGNGDLADLSKQLMARLRRRFRGKPQRVVVDAGAAQNHDRLFELVDRPNQVTIVRVPRRSPYRKKWAELPGDAWTDIEEPGPFTGAPPKQIAIAEMRMTVSKRQIRTIVIKERHRRGKLRWHALWVFGDDTTNAYEIVRQFRQRQHHEQTYRIMLHDLFVDTAPSGYNKDSTNPKRPGFKQNALTLYAWVAALAANALDAFATQLPGRLPHQKPSSLPNRLHPRSLRRWLFLTPAEIFLATDALIVLLQPGRLHSLWKKLIDRANQSPVRIPWMENRRLILSIKPEGPFDPADLDPCVRC